jgi:CheY-like chemotaxis protein
MKTRVLIVEDNIDIACSLQIMLSHAGHEVESIYNGEEVYARVFGFDPDVLVLDIFLSGSDGQKIAKALKNSERTKDLPIIMISAHPNGAKIAQESGADLFLAKPFSSEKLLESINKAFSKKLMK